MAKIGRNKLRSEVPILWQIGQLIKQREYSNNYIL